MLNSHQSRQLVRLRWTAFVIVGVAYVLSFFHRFAPAAISADLQQTFHASGAELGGLAATYFYVYTVMQIPTGVLADTLGPRRVVAIGGLIAGLGSMLFGMADTLTAASIGRLLVGLGVSVMFISMLKLNAAWFHDRHFATMTGATILLGNVGSLLASAPLAWALNYISWRTAFVAVGVFSLLLASLAMGGLQYFLARYFDWIALGEQEGLRALAMAGSLAASALLYFAMLALSGLKLRQFVRRG